MGETNDEELSNLVFERVMAKMKCSSCRRHYIEGERILTIVTMLCGHSAC